MAQKYPNKIPIPVMQDGTPINLPSKNFLNGTGGIPLRGGNVAVLPNTPQQPQINPMEVYKNLGINTTQQGNYFMPNTYADLQKGIENGLNFGNKQLADSYKNPFYTKDTALQGIQQNKNFGNPFLASLEKQQGFLPKNEIAVNNIQPEQATIQQNEIVNPPVHQNTFMENFKQHPFQTIGKGLESPIGRGLVVSALGMATGVNPMLSAGYGFNTMANNYNNRTQDTTNRAFLESQMPGSTAGFAGYITNDAMKNYTDNYSKFETLSTKRELLNLRRELGTTKDKNTQIKMLDERYNKGIISAADYKAEMERLGITVNDVQASNQTKDTNSKVESRDVNNKFVTEKTISEKAFRKPKIDNITANTDYTKVKTTLAPVETGIRQQNANTSSFKASKVGAGGGGSGGRKLPAGQALKIGESDTALSMINELKSSANKLPERLTTPGIAQISSLNPWDTDAQSFNQYINTVKQVVGKGLEGGVLRKEDEIKYAKILPKVGDTKPVIQNKLNQLNKMIEMKRQSELDNYEKFGFDVSGLQKNNKKPLSPVEQEMKRRGLLK